MRSIAQWFDAAENFRLHVCSLNSLHKDWLIDIVFQAAAETCFLAPYNGSWRSGAERRPDYGAKQEAVMQKASAS